MFIALAFGMGSVTKGIFTEVQKFGGIGRLSTPGINHQTALKTGKKIDDFLLSSPREIPCFKDKTMVCGIWEIWVYIS